MVAVPAEVACDTRDVTESRRNSPKMTNFFLTLSQLSHTRTRPFGDAANQGCLPAAAEQNWAELCPQFQFGSEIPESFVLGNVLMERGESCQVLQHLVCVVPVLGLPLASGGFRRGPCPQEHDWIPN